MNTTKEMREKLREQCRVGMTDMVSPFQALSNASARNLCETIMALLDDIEELQQAEKQAVQASGASECRYEKLHQAAVLALEVIEKHRQMQGEAPMGMLGYRAIKVLEDAIFEPEQDAPMSNDKLVQAIRRLRRGGAGYVLGDVACNDLLHWLEAYAVEKQVAAPADAPADAQHQAKGTDEQVYAIAYAIQQTFFRELSAYSAGDIAQVVRMTIDRPQAPAPAPDEWRKLAQQFDGQRMAAMAHLRTLLDNPQAHAEAARAFLAATPAEQIASVPQAPAEGDEPLYLLHCGQIDSSGEQDEWDVEADSYKRVEEFCRLHPGQTVKLYPHPQPKGAPVGEIAEMDDGALVPVWTDGTPAAGTKLYAAPTQAPAPAPEESADLRFSWMDFQQIGDVPAVDEAIRNLLDDPTEDNSTCMVRAICEAAADRLVALAASQSSAVAHGWRPIETAPKDGTVIALRRDKYVYSGRWGNGTYNTGWLAHGSYMVFAFSPLNPPTHWMPLESDVPVQENDRG